MMTRKGGAVAERVVVVGGSSGIGLATAARLAGTGYEVIITGRDQEKLRSAAKELNGSARGEQADAGDAEAMRTLFASIGRVDHVVVTVTGNGGAGPFRSIDPDDLLRGLTGKVIAQVVTAQAALEVLRVDGSLTFVTAASSG